MELIDMGIKYFLQLYIWFCIITWSVIILYLSYHGIRMIYMKFILPIKELSPPKGKRTIKLNMWGNWVGYISGRRYKDLGCSEYTAKEWLTEE